MVWGHLLYLRTVGEQVPLAGKFNGRAQFQTQGRKGGMMGQ